MQEHQRSLESHQPMIHQEILNDASLLLVDTAISNTAAYSAITAAVYTIFHTSPGSLAFS